MPGTGRQEGAEESIYTYSRYKEGLLYMKGRKLDKK
jgi:hypothetical protein